jgi:hypothetical protein
VEAIHARADDEAKQKFAGDRSVFGSLMYAVTSPMSPQ